MSDVYQADSELVEPTVVGPKVAQNAQSVPEAIVLWLGMGFVFVRVSMLNQLLSYVSGHNFRLLYLFGIPAAVGLVASGAILRALRSRAVIFWVCFAAWGTIAIPFSIWRGGSAHTMWAYWSHELIVMFVIGGLARTWRDCRVVMSTIAAAAAVSLLSAKFFGQVEGAGRLSLDFGTVANANDFAGHLLLVLPFLLWIVLSSKARPLRVIALCGLAYGLFVVLATASRGALIALVFDVLFFMFAARRRYRIAFAVVAPITLAAAMVVLPAAVRNRLVSFSSREAHASQEAIASSEARGYLLRDSIVCAFQNPIFGIGPGQFTTYEGRKGLAGTGASWHGAHNSYAEAASECGIPGLLFFIAGVSCTWHLLEAVRRRTRRKPQLLEMTNALFCVQLAMVGFCVAIFFLNFTYFYYLPATAGLATAFVSAARKELSKWSTDTHDANALHFTWNGPAAA